MPEYRRSRVPGGTLFFTLNLLDRRSDLLVAPVDVLREAVRWTRLRSPFRIDAWVVLPDHVHCLSTPAFERVRELKDGWVGTVRPSRQPRCGFLRMRRFLNAINNIRHGEERRRRVSNHAQRPCRTRLSFRDQFLHTLLRRGSLLPPGDADFPGRWRAIKIAFAKSLPKGEPRSPVMTRRGERGIWQRRYWEHTIRDERGFRRAHGLYAFPPGARPSLPRDPRVKPGEGRVREGSTRRTGRTRRSAGCREWPLSRRMDRRQRRAASDRRAAVKSETDEHRAKP